MDMLTTIVGFNDTNIIWFVHLVDKLISEEPSSTHSV